MTELIKVSVLLLAAQAVIYSGIYFVGGVFFAQNLAPLYQATGSFLRLLIALATVFLLGNLIMGYTFGNFSPHITAPVAIAVVVLIQIVFSVFAFHLRVSPWIVPATVIVIAGCVWVSYLLQNPVAK